MKRLEELFFRQQAIYDIRESTINRQISEALQAKDSLKAEKGDIRKKCIGLANALVYKKGPL